MINMAWNSDVELTVNRLAADKSKIADLDHFYQTVGHIEDMRNPDGKGPLTLSALEAWEERCRKSVIEERPDAGNTIAEDTQDRSLRNTRKTVNPRGAGPLHPHHQ